MPTEGRRAFLGNALAALDRWFWRLLIVLLVVVALIAIFLLLGSGTGGSGAR